MDFKDQGAQAERDERADATSLYEQALEIALLLFATEGMARSTPRAELDERLAKIPEERDRLVDARVLRMAQDTPQRLRRSLTPDRDYRPASPQRSADLRQHARSGHNAVRWPHGYTLLRVKRLGVLSSQSLSLRPGRYTAVGMRNGFRDVRSSRSDWG